MMRSGSIRLLGSVNGHNACKDEFFFRQNERNAVGATTISMEECTSWQATLRYSGKMLVDSKSKKKEDFSSVLYRTAYL